MWCDDDLLLFHDNVSEKENERDSGGTVIMDKSCSGNQRHGEPARQNASVTWMGDNFCVTKESWAIEWRPCQFSNGPHSPVGRNATPRGRSDEESRLKKMEWAG